MISFYLFCTSGTVICLRLETAQPRGQVHEIVENCPCRYATVAIQGLPPCPCLIHLRSSVRSGVSYLLTRSYTSHQGLPNRRSGPQTIPAEFSIIIFVLICYAKKTRRVKPTLLPTWADPQSLHQYTRRWKREQSTIIKIIIMRCGAGYYLLGRLWLLLGVLWQYHCVFKEPWASWPHLISLGQRRSTDLPCC
ncbi:hypothetical protein F5Y12DRAFT_376057 [Xylaria sp. FL1777]|nr:hypothetical protein F5Y12DRAFT_376057 [Xylaria sp. FL1777]